MWGEFQSELACGAGGIWERLRHLSREPCFAGTGHETGGAAREGGRGSHTLWSSDLEDHLIFVLFLEELSDSQ